MVGVTMSHKKCELKRLKAVFIKKSFSRLTLGDKN